MDVQSNWWEHFFEGAPVDLWLQALSPEHTAREADSLVRALDVSPHAELLDVPCGSGRLSLELASRGHHLTGVDWSHEFLAHARSSDAARDVTWERRDMRDLPWPARFDGAFCLGNSFGYLDDEGNEAFLHAVAAADMRSSWRRAAMSLPAWTCRPSSLQRPGRRVLNAA